MTEATLMVQDEAPISNIVEYQPSSSDKPEKILVIGAGPAGVHFAKDYLKRRPLADITVFGNEPYQPYNRVQLSSLLAGDISYDDIVTNMPDEKLHPNFSISINTIRRIDVKNQCLIDIHDVSHSYDKLVIATGSRPHQPNIPGVDQAGVYTFRNLKDAEFLYARVSRARHVVVVGGGLLGLEAAKALLRFNTKVTVIQQGERLMNRQLDSEAADNLRQLVEDQGIEVITNSGVRKILGEERVSGVVTRDKQTIECDTVLLCTGIKPNLEIARAANIKVGRGIIIDEKLRTSVENVYAIGECCEYKGSTFGLVNPGYEQAAILADTFDGGDSSYVGSLEVSRLKVLDTQICSMGDVAELDESRPFIRTFRFRNKKDNIYRKIVTYKGGLVGAVGFGLWQESRRIQEAYQSRRRIWPWQILYFLFTGNLFLEGKKNEVNSWPKAAVVCQCNNITQGELVDEIDSGKNTLSKLQSATRAGTVCGSCKPLLNDLLGYTGPTEKEKAWVTTFIASLFAIVIASAITFLPELNVSDSVQSPTSLEHIWNDKFWKQVTGFSLLGLSLIGLLMSIRKKLSSARLGHYAYWRVMHTVLGVFCATTLILHTGFHLGSNFNQILMIDFLGVLILGSLAGVILSLSHKLKANTAKKLRRFWTWAHILFTWPLPILLGFHILTVYYF